MSHTPTDDKIVLNKVVGNDLERKIPKWNTIRCFDYSGLSMIEVSNGKEILAFCLYIEEKEPVRMVEIVLLHTHPSFGRRGFASLLLSHIYEIAGDDPITLTCNTSEGKQLYQKHGFKLFDGIRVNCYSTPALVRIGTHTTPEKMLALASKLSYDGNSLDPVREEYLILGANWDSKRERYVW